MAQCVRRRTVFSVGAKVKQPALLKVAAEFVEGGTHAAGHGMLSTTGKPNAICAAKVALSNKNGAWSSVFVRVRAAPSYMAQALTWDCVICRPC